MKFYQHLKSSSNSNNNSNSEDLMKKKEDKCKKDDSPTSAIVERVAHRRNGSEVMRIRRENSDFFVPSTRHSAVFLESKSIPQSLRRGSDVVAGTSSTSSSSANTNKANNNGEPILTNVTTTNEYHKDEPLIRPRRERTEGDIVLHRSSQRLRNTLEARARHIASRLTNDGERQNKSDKVSEGL